MLLLLLLFTCGKLPPSLVMVHVVAGVVGILWNWCEPVLRLSHDMQSRDNRPTAHAVLRYNVNATVAYVLF